MIRISTETKARLTFAILTLVLGILAIIGAGSLPFGTISRIQPGFFPMIFGILVVFFSVLMIVQVLAQIKKETGPHSEQEESELNLRGMGMMSVVFIVYVLLSYTVGYVLATAFALAGSSYLLGLRGWKLVALILIATSVTWFFFETLLGIRLPSGMWS